MYQQLMTDEYGALGKEKSKCKCVPVHEGILGIRSINPLILD